ncbi:MAG: hypothetical protein ABI461_02535, partial [Polyangiaceae bacterium]
MNPSKLRALTALGVVAAAVPAIAQTAQKQAIQSFKSTQADREDVAITVYNQNFGLVREVRNITVGQGRSELEFGDVAE